MVEEKKYDELHEHDQLNQSRSSKKSFVDYKEGRITFRPTYKYDPGTDVWDSSEKGRAPAWCDRIMWRSFGYYIKGTQRHAQVDDFEIVLQKAYRSHPKLRLSDHKPVSALFDVKIKVVNAEKQKKIYEDIMKRMDKLENEFLPQVELDSLEASATARQTMLRNNITNE
jgi:phosphatidylinositol-bisphosphatase